MLSRRKGSAVDSGHTNFPLSICSIVTTHAEKPLSDPAMSVAGVSVTSAESNPARSAWLVPREEHRDGFWQKCWARGSAEAALLSAVGSLQHHWRCFPGAVGGDSGSPVCIPAFCESSIPRAYPRPTTTAVEILPASSLSLGFPPQEGFVPSDRFLLEAGSCLACDSPNTRGSVRPRSQAPRSR